MHLKFPKQAIFVLLLTLGAATSHASLSTDLQELLSGLTTLNNQLATVSVSQGDSCTQLGALNTSIENYIASTENMTEQLAAPLNLTDDDMSSLDGLSNTIRSMSAEAVRISWELRDIENIYQVVEYRAAISAMLRLSEDIGKMADRILEMADRILVMADNIGIMADRILITQQLQNTNVALTQAAMLTTQQNMVAMRDSISTIIYNLTLGQLSDQTQALAADMSNTVLTETNMASTLAALEIQTTAVLTATINAYVWATQNSQVASHYINGDTLTALGDLSAIHTALGNSLEAFANAVTLLSPVTDNIILHDATNSMLQLSQDICLMADRIMEMTDKIIVMADNMGLMADRIVATQNIQQTNIDLTQNSVLTARNVTITTIQNRGL